MQMPDTLQFLLWFLGTPVALAVVAVVGAGFEWTILRIENAVAATNGRREESRVRSAERASWSRDHAAFVEWLESQAGGTVPDGSVDEELVEAHRQAELIRFLVEEEVPKSVMRCLEAHRLMASVTGARHFSEVAYEPECHRLRASVVWLLAHTVKLLETYPLRLLDGHLMHNSIVLRKRAYPTCRRCPYMEMAVSQAPPLCPTAELVQIRSACDETIK